MSFSKKPESHAHMTVLSLCVLGCLTSALWQGPQDPATSKLPVIPGPELEQPAPVQTGRAELPPAR
ncbi:MAG: hypothetical protein O2816_18390 [Planctomycetota bacterium]|nr:hypothetical protein [Planctomycetota bacterium]